MHTDAADAAATGWHQIVALYDQLTVFSPTPVVAPNRTVAVAEVDGPAAALAIVDDLDLGHYYLYQAIRADLLRRLAAAPRQRPGARRPSTAPRTRPDASS